MHISIPIANTMEYIKDTEVSPFISKGVCKVCYVGQQPNRNHTVITKELAADMGRKILGSPVVGFYNQDKKDFEGHEREIVVQGGKFEIVDMTKPYGFVPTDADVWFQKFNDEGVEHEYLCTNVYLWTKTYPEAKRVLEQGNNQSMELDDETSNGFWTNDDKTNARIFIYNEALVEKLCILGEDVEPCFEGSQFKTSFSLESSPEFQEFKATMFSMLTELQETLSKGGSQESMEETKTLTQETEFEKKPEDQEEDKKNPETEAPEEKDDEKKKPSGDNACGDGDKKKYDLADVIEYAELKAQYDELQSKYEALEQSNTTLNEEVTFLREFKLTAEREQKQSMIDKFYMLSDEDKKDVVDHIDTYSLDDIEGKLSIICVRNKVNFNLESENNNPQGLFNLNEAAGDDGAPEWIKAIRETAKKQ